MSDDKSVEVLQRWAATFPPNPEFSSRAHIKSLEEYEALYQRSIRDSEGFWAERASELLHWERKWEQVLKCDFRKPEVRWFIGGKLNASYNCLDRHLVTWRKNKAAIIWEADDGAYRTYTYQQLHAEVNRFACVLRKKGVRRGDRVAIYLPMVPELPIAMLACCRIGAVHSVVFGGFSALALRDRIRDCSAKLLVTADRGVRGGRHVPLKANADEAAGECPTIEAVIVVRRTDGDVPMKDGRDTWWHEETAAADIPLFCEPEMTNAEDPLFVLYTSGSTGKPKGVLHAIGGYLVFTALTFKWIFDYREEDTHFCTADIGWITGHSYTVYGPLAAGATSLLFEGVPTYPRPDRFWDIVDKHRVNIFYTAPTAIRALMKEGEKWVETHDLSSLRVLGTVGEPINPEAWIWYYTHVGKKRVPIVDTWWQTETGGVLITPLPGVHTLKPGSANKPFFGVVPSILKENGAPADVNEGGYLVIEAPWPGMLAGMYGDLENRRMKEVYFSKFPGRYFTGDGARVDGDGDYWLMGRIDDVLKVSGHRLGTAELENALASHPSVAESAVVGYSHEVKGDGIYAYVVLKEGYVPDEDLRKSLAEHVRRVVGPIAKPDKLQFTQSLPKTRSGKIMRRILRKIANGETGNLGDISTLADPGVVKELIKERM